MSPTSYLTAPPRVATTRLVKACSSVNAMAELLVYAKRTWTTSRKLAALLEDLALIEAELLDELFD
jgi:hypothetical protein